MRKRAPTKQAAPGLPTLQRGIVTSVIPSAGQHSMKLGRSVYSGALADQLRQAIIGGEIKGGTLLLEARLAAEMNISRGPVRTALHALEGEGLVRTLPNGRMIAESFGSNELRDLFATRLDLESAAIRSLVAGKAPLDALVETLEAIEARAGATADLVDLDLTFHQSLLTLSSRRFLAHAWSALAPAIHAVIAIGNRDLAVSDPDGYSGRIVHNHRRLLRAIQQGDSEAAIRMLKQQFAAAQKRYDAVRGDRE
jgi:GntR family transcriptional regulator, gluconate operon transcriptional repressor